MRGTAVSCFHAAPATRLLGPRSREAILFDMDSALYAFDHHQGHAHRRAHHRVTGHAATGSLDAMRSMPCCTGKWRVHRDDRLLRPGLRSAHHHGNRQRRERDPQALRHQPWASNAPSRHPVVARCGCSAEQRLEWWRHRAGISCVMPTVDRAVKRRSTAMASRRDLRSARRECRG